MKSVWRGQANGLSAPGFDVQGAANAAVANEQPAFITELLNTTKQRIGASDSKGSALDVGCGSRDLAFGNAVI